MYFNSVPTILSTLKSNKRLNNVSELITYCGSYTYIYPAGPTLECGYDVDLPLKDNRIYVSRLVSTSDEISIFSKHH